LTSQKDRYYSLGFNHETCPLDLREAFAIGEDELAHALKSLHGTGAVREAVILSTCNRTEVYSVTDDSDSISHWLTHFRGSNERQVEPFLYNHMGEQAARHTFRVASGLDSMVLGETQILGQLKNAVRVADSVGSVGPKLRKLFDASFSVAKHVRTTTDVGAHSISLAAASAKVSERIFDSLSESKVLFIGAGDMNRLCGEYFATLNVSGMSFANRTFSRAKALAEKLNGDVISYNDVVERLYEFDVVVSCTGSPIPIIGKGAVERAIERRRHRPILLIDLAVPRDIEFEVSDLSDVFLYTIDDLGEIVKDGISNRESAALDAEKIIEHRLSQFKLQLDREKITPVIKKFRQRGELIMQLELEKALSSISKGEAPEKVVKILSRGISNKFMDEPSRALNRETGKEKLSLSEALEKLYSLDKN
jgi:glutamyl-tRNA reductase